MLDDCNYNKVRLLHDLSRMAHFVRQHAQNDAKRMKHSACDKMYDQLYKDLEKHIGTLRKGIEGLCKTGKFK